MPIEKESSATLIHAGLQFDVFPRQVVQVITDPVALAYYAFLLSMPDTWIVRRKHLMDHFSVGRTLHDRAMKVLRELGLIDDVIIRGEGGQIKTRSIVVYTVPKTFTSGLETVPQVTSGLKTDNEVKPASGKTDHLEIPTLLRDTDIVIKADMYRSLDISNIPVEFVEQVKEFIDHRINKKSKLTQKALERFMTAAFKAGQDLHLDPNIIIAETIDAGWCAVKTDWLHNRLGKDSNQGSATRDRSLSDDLNDRSWAR